MSEPDKQIRDRDLFQRGASVSRVVALSAGHSLLANDPDFAFVSILDTLDRWWKAEEILDAAFARGTAPAHP